MRGDSKVGYMKFFVDGPLAGDMNVTGLAADLFEFHPANLHAIVLYKRQTPWEPVHDAVSPEFLTMWSADYAVVASEVVGGRGLKGDIPRPGLVRELT